MFDGNKTIQAIDLTDDLSDDQTKKDIYKEILDKRISNLRNLICCRHSN